jgi:hypothetical protein
MAFPRQDRAQAPGRRRSGGVSRILEDGEIFFLFRPTEDEDELVGQVYETRTRGERRHRPPARPVGEGVCAIALTAGQLHLTYVLDLPEQTDAVQRDVGRELKLEPGRVPPRPLVEGVWG